MNRRIAWIKFSIINVDLSGAILYMSTSRTNPTRTGLGLQEGPTDTDYVLNNEDKDIYCYIWTYFCIK